MNCSKNPNKKFLVCQGPGCKAWDSEEVLSMARKCLENDQGIQTCSMTCVNNCGGGVSIGMPSSKKFIKVREPSEVSALLNQNSLKKAV